MEVNKELLNSYRKENNLLKDKITCVEQELKELKELLDECYKKINKHINEREYYKYKYLKKTNWFFNPPEPVKMDVD